MPDVEGLVRALSLEGDDGRFVLPATDPAGGFLAAGMLAALSVTAAARALPEAEIRSAHSVFLRAASPAAPLEITVETLHAGRQMSVALVRTSQSDRLCATAQVVLGPRGDDLIVHQHEAPGVAPPDGLPHARAANPAELRVVDGVDPYDPDLATAPEWHVWARAEGLPRSGGIPEAYVALEANSFLVSAAVLAHKGVTMDSAHNDLMAVINTSDVVFHQSFDPTSWLLFSQESTFAAGGWVFGRGQVFDGAGTLVASFAEEAMLRALPPGRGPGL